MSTPPCPNCGTVYFETPSRDGWRAASITDAPVFDDNTFIGHEYYCRKCQHRWRVAAKSDVNRPG